ncbi:hypothetical protein M3J09_009569 [Ascochyta lentis]
MQCIQCSSCSPPRPQTTPSLTKRILNLRQPESHTSCLVLVCLRTTTLKRLL